MCVCEAWSLTLREEHRLRVLENGVLRKLFGPKKDEVKGNWRRLHNEELYALYSSPNVIRMIKSRKMTWMGQVTRMGDRRGACRILVGRLEGRRPFERPRIGCEDNIKMNLQEVGWGGMGWTDLAWDRDSWQAIVKAAMNIRVPKNDGKSLFSWGPVSFSGKILLHGVSKLISRLQNLRLQTAV